MVRQIPRARAESHCNLNHAPLGDCDARRRNPRHGTRADRRVGESPGACCDGWPLLKILESTHGVGFYRRRDADDSLTSQTKTTAAEVKGMVDRQKLGAWIQSQHLEEAALEQYRK